MERREIAAMAGVTPALVSYYFPNKWDLFSAAAQPVVRDYIKEVLGIINSSHISYQKVFYLIYLFLDFNIQHGYLLDFYMENIDELSQRHDIVELRHAHAEILYFFSELQSSGYIKEYNAAFLMSSIWGMCKNVAQQPHLADLRNAARSDNDLTPLATQVCALFLNGASTAAILPTADTREP